MALERDSSVIKMTGLEFNFRRVQEMCLSMLLTGYPRSQSGIRRVDGSFFLR